MQNFFKLRDSKKSLICGKHLGHVPKSPYKPPPPTHTHPLPPTLILPVGGTLVETLPQVLSCEQFIRGE